MPFIGTHSLRIGLAWKVPSAAEPDTNWECVRAWRGRGSSALVEVLDGLIPINGPTQRSRSATALAHL
jgi:hypothetical protein